MRFPPPDPLSTILLYLGAIIMALTAALAPGTPLAKTIPAATMNGVWPFVPLGLMTIAAIIWIVRGIFSPGGTSSVVAQADTPDSTPWLTPYLKGFIVIMTMLVVYDFAMKVIGHL
jgi:hypothetical protein